MISNSKTPVRLGRRAGSLSEKNLLGSFEGIVIIIQYILLCQPPKMEKTLCITIGFDSLLRNLWGVL